MNETSNSRAPKPSHVSLPECGQPYPSILDFLDNRFPKVGRSTWSKRLADGKIATNGDTTITPDTPYKPGMTIYYYREVENERTIPFTEDIVFRNDHILVACKPHFLPVTPSGPYVNECLLYRLKESTGLDYLVPLHRLDRETAGLVMFSINKDSAGQYGDLFDYRKVTKTYEAVGPLPEDSDRTEWLVETRIVTGDHWLIMKNEKGEPNSKTRIRLFKREGKLGLFELDPHTGKTHQLRLHMTEIGTHILNDRFYPVLQPESEDDFDKPLQLLAKRISFEDPVTGRPVSYESHRTLVLPTR